MQLATTLLLALASTTFALPNPTDADLANDAMTNDAMTNDAMTNDAMANPSNMNTDIDISPFVGSSEAWPPCCWQCPAIFASCVEECKKKHPENACKIACKAKPCYCTKSC